MKKLNNKGFSLVELIIVIAIMAILIGVVGTQVIPYLENSRKAKDAQVFSSWNTAGMSAYSTAAGSLDGSTTYVIKITQTDVTCTADTSGAIVKTFCELTGLKATGGANQIKDKMTSKDGKNDVNQVVITIPATGSIYTVIGDGTKFDTIYNK